MRNRYTLGLMAALAVILSLSPTAARAQTWSSTRGTVTYALDLHRLETLGLDHSWTFSGAYDEPTATFALDPAFQIMLAVDPEGVVHVASGSLAHAGGIEFSSGEGSFLFSGGMIVPDAQREDIALHLRSAERGDANLLDFRNVKIGLDVAAGSAIIHATDLVITDAFATQLGDVALAGESIGIATLIVDVVTANRLRAGDGPQPIPQGGNNGTVCPNPVGPDVIVGDLLSPCNYSRVGDIDAFALGTTSCNIGDQNLPWLAYEANHPVIGQNLYRLKNGRFEQVGLSWLKHGFTALTQNVCGCGCNGQGGPELGVGCSDPYTCGLNGQQGSSGNPAYGGLGPRYEVNAFTGEYQFPYAFMGQTGNSIFKRLQVHVDDLDPTLNAGALYFGEGQYITPADAQIGNGENNCSYRQVSVATGTSTQGYNVANVGNTVRELPAIYAWPANDASISFTEVRVPGEGLMILAGKATDVGGGVWHYDYALYNMNSHRSAGSFTVPYPGGATVTSVGFHDVDYHSGEPYDLTDWASMLAGGSVVWSTDDYAANQNANALRWGTLYNFRFNVNAAPVTDADIVIGLFRPGSPNSVTVPFLGPPTGAADCQPNGVGDDQDISGGTSDDCNADGIPDECQTPPIAPGGADCNGDLIPDECQLGANDCNTNGIPDDCDISFGAGFDCDSNGVLDECEGVCCDGAACDDGDPCTENDTCSSNFCAGVPVVCDDGDPCNGVETCDAGTGACVPGSCSGEEVVLSANFNTSAAPFSYQDDTFRGTNDPAHADGFYEASGGQSGGGVRVRVGINSSAGMSGGWVAPFTLTSAPLSVEIELSYRLQFNGAYESDEYGQALMSIDGTLIGVNPNDYLLQYIGNGSSSFDSGWITGTFNVSLGAGAHQIAVGAFNNKSTTSSEQTHAYFDNITITAVYGAACPCCEGGEPIDCDDGNPCTDEVCHPVSGCEYTDNSNACDDSNACTEGDICAAGTCGGSMIDCNDSDICTDDTCNPATGCVNAFNTAPCDDGDACTESDACAMGECEGDAADCDDGDACTDDSCNSATGCEHTFNTAPCDDGDACTANDVCALGACDGFTIDCDDQLYCSGVETCDSQSGCISDGNPCGADEFCNEATDTCDACIFDADCDGDVDLDDYWLLWDCLDGPGISPNPQASSMTSQDCLNHFDQNGDLDVDLGDAAEFLSEYGVP